MALIRGGKRRSNPRGNTVIKPGDVLLVEGGQEALKEFLGRSRLRPRLTTCDD